MFRMRLMTAGAAAALLMAPAAMAQDQTATPPNVGEVPETNVTASQPRPNPGEDSAPPATEEARGPKRPARMQWPMNRPMRKAGASLKRPPTRSNPKKKPSPSSLSHAAEPEPVAQPTPDPMTPNDAMTPPDGMEPPADTTTSPAAHRSGAGRGRG